MAASSEVAIQKPFAQQKGDCDMAAFALRLDELRKALEAQSLDAIVISQPQNRRYLSGFTGSAGTLFITQGKAVLITDFRYVEQAPKEAPRFQVIKADPEALPQKLNDLAAEAGAKRVAFESHHLSFADYTSWAEAADGFKWVPTREVVEDMRALKDEEELEAIRKAVALGDAALAHIKEILAPGMTEKEVAWELEVYMRTHGAEAVGYETIVAGGPNGARPHARPSDDVIQFGQPIVIDVGARVEGYHSDLTRTLYLGAPDENTARDGGAGGGCLGSRYHRRCRIP
jgi:Xaa-Pro aminopeptidase